MKEIVHGTEINYHIEGKGEKRVLLLHGWGCDMSLMQPVSDALSQDFRIMMIDFPGHGKSSRPPAPWGVPEFAACLEEMLIKLDFAPCTVIAHSVGCRIATWLAASNPSLFGKIVFTGAAGIHPTPTAESQKRAKKYRRLKTYCQTIARIPFLRKACISLENKLREIYGSRDYNALDEEMRKTFVKVINQDLSDLYEKIQSSTLLIWGDADTETPLWMGKKMEELIPDAGLVIFENGTHFAYLEQLQRFAAICIRFLKGDEQ